MLSDVLTGWTAEFLGSLTLLVGAATWHRLRRRQTAVVSSTPPAATGVQPVRTYTLLGARASDGQPVHLPSSRSAGTRVTWKGPTGAKERFVLTDAVLQDGTHAAEKVSVYDGR
ncbi:hypothetical protein ABZY57_04550 [Streptomyces sp. NPDC006450]|uniref:hypothetical protein n=1 Tax=Streptomyces sp. NPDC006450 TaxID=3155458 RepID=UPI0033B91DD0